LHSHLHHHARLITFQSLSRTSKTRMKSSSDRLCSSAQNNSSALLNQFLLLFLSMSIQKLTLSRSTASTLRLRQSALRTVFKEAAQAVSSLPTFSTMVLKLGTSGTRAQARLHPSPLISSQHTSSRESGSALPTTAPTETPILLRFHS